jgi:hypothetical protein
MQNTQGLKKYTSKGRTFTPSSHHKDMWIIEDGQDKTTGKDMFHAIYASDKEIVAMFPPDPVKADKSKRKVLPPHYLQGPK